MLTLRHDQTWRLAAACRHTDPAQWDSPVSRSQDQSREHVVSQRSICADCPVLAECAADSTLSRDSGVIRAGVPIPETGKVGKNIAYRALDLLAIGGSMAEAVEILESR